MAIAYFYSRMSLLRSHQASQQINSGRVRDQPGLLVPEASFITGLPLRQSPIKKLRPPRLWRKNTKFSFHLSPVPSVRSVFTVKEPGLKRISVPSLNMKKGRSGSRLNQVEEGNSCLETGPRQCSRRIHIHRPFTVGPHWKIIASVFGTDRSVNSKRNVRLVMKWANFMNHL